MSDQRAVEFRAERNFRGHLQAISQRKQLRHRQGWNLPRFTQWAWILKDLYLNTFFCARNIYWQSGLRHCAKHGGTSKLNRYFLGHYRASILGRQSVSKQTHKWVYGNWSGLSWVQWQRATSVAGSGKVTLKRRYSQLTPGQRQLAPRSETERGLENSRTQREESIAGALWVTWHPPLRMEENGPHSHPPPNRDNAALQQNKEGLGLHFIPLIAQSWEAWIHQHTQTCSCYLQKYSSFMKEKRLWQDLIARLSSHLPSQEKNRLRRTWLWWRRTGEERPGPWSRTLTLGHTPGGRPGLAITELGNLSTFSELGFSTL